MGPDRGKFLCVCEESAWYSRRTIANGGHMSGIRTEAGAHPLSLCALMYYYTWNSRLNSRLSNCIYCWAVPSNYRRSAAACLALGPCIHAKSSVWTPLGWHTKNIYIYLASDFAVLSPIAQWPIAAIFDCACAHGALAVGAAYGPNALRPSCRHFFKNDDWLNAFYFTAKFVLLKSRQYVEYIHIYIWGSILSAPVAVLRCSSLFSCTRTPTVCLQTNRRVPFSVHKNSKRMEGKREGVSGLHAKTIHVSKTLAAALAEFDLSQSFSSIVGTKCPYPCYPNSSMLRKLYL